MKFSNIKIIKEQSSIKGIKEIDIQRLSDVIAFVGKNGSGKTRILDLIEDNLFSPVNISNRNLTNGTISCLPISVRRINQPINQGQIQLIIQTLHPKYLRRIRYDEIRQLQQAVEGTNQQQNNSEITFENLMENVVENADYNELGSMYKNALKFLIRLPHQLVEDKLDCMLNSKELEKRISYKRYLSLQKFVLDLIKKELTWDSQVGKSKQTDTGNNLTVSGTWKLNGREFNYNEFSDGEKVLFSYALLFFLLDQNPNLNIRESIILIDEPELHLHPDSEIDLIEGIKNVIKEKGQLIIATHSLNILSMLNYEEIFMVKDGVITSPSQATPSKSLSELMGIEERVNKLTDFLNSTSTWAFVNFITQCFSDPEAIATANPNDPQIEAFKKAIKERTNNNSNILLDFGAGKGRVYKQLQSDSDFIKNTNYCALEPNPDCHTDLKTLGVSNVYTTHTELPRNSFDFVLLCNVLHEIPLKKWKDSLNAIIDSLKSNGYLIIIEAKVLSKGEKIGEVGYLLLGLEEIKQLFSLSSLPLNIKIDENDKITCVAIEKSKLQFQIYDSYIKNALQTLEKNTLKEIEEIRSKEDYNENELYAIGRKTAFLSQQHINAKIAQKHL